MYWHFLPIFSQSGSSPAQRNSNEYNFGCPRDDYDAADLELARLSYILAKCQSASHLKVPLNYASSSPSPYSTPTTNTTTVTSTTTIPAVASSTFQRLPSAFSSSGEAAHASAAALNQEAPQSRKRRLPQAPQIGGWAAGMMLRSSKSEQNLVSSASAAFSDR